MELKKEKQSLYEILEVSPDAPQEEIHQAFLKAKHTYSSDSPALYSVFTKEEAEELLRLIENAYAVLGNPLKRKEYDDKVLGKPHTPKARESRADKVSNVKAPTVSPEMMAEADIWAEARIISKTKEEDSSIGRTALSNYDVSESFEAEIAHQQVWDGTFLQKVREYKNVTIDQLTKYTRIGRHYIEALEANDFHSLPAQVFVRGFVAQISRLLNLNEKVVTESYMKLFKESREK